MQLKGLTSFLLVASVALVIGSVACLAIGLFERGIIRAEQNIGTLDYREAEARLRTVERVFAFGSRFPWVGRDPLDALGARLAQLDYWQREYPQLVTQQANPSETAGPHSGDLQLVVAHAIYRTGQSQAKDRATALRALDASIKAYENVLGHGTHRPEAAYNYELLLRLRDAVEERRKPPLPSSPNESFGRGGSPLMEEESEATTFKTYTPLESEERRKGAEAGKVPPKARKG